MTKPTVIRRGKASGGAPLRMERLRVELEFPVWFTPDAFGGPPQRLARVLKREPGTRRVCVMVYIDGGVLAGRRNLPRCVSAWFRRQSRDFQLAAPPCVLAGGERAKNNTALLRRLLRDLASCGLSRHDVVLVIGGGAVLDAVGLAASLVHRGLRVARMPTTALAQCDSGVGVKTAVNFRGVKNLLGTFAAPFAVINDASFLRTLSPAEWTAGIAEAFKVAIIRDATFFAYLCRQVRALRERRLEVLETVIRRCARLHLDHIRTSGDPFEQGSARPLDFGHWAAHKLESLSRFRIGHGAAVAVGLALDSCYARRAGYLAAAPCAAILEGLAASGALRWYPELDRIDRHGRPALLDGLREFQEHLGGRLCITLPRGIGHKREVHRMSTRRIELALDDVRAFLRWRSADADPD